MVICYSVFGTLAFGESAFDESACDEYMSVSSMQFMTCLTPAAATAAAAATATAAAIATLLPVVVLLSVRSVPATGIFEGQLFE